MGCHRNIIKRRSIDFAQDCSWLFFPPEEREAIIYLITGTCSLATGAGSTHRMLVMNNNKKAATAKKLV